jgi:hypothetical protein
MTMTTTAQSDFVYENWTAEHKAVIHEASCGSCNPGLGCHANPLGNKNGRWHGLLPWPWRRPRRLRRGEPSASTARDSGVGRRMW